MPGFLFSRLAGPIASGVAVALLISLAVVILSKNGAIRELRGQLVTVTAERDVARRDLAQCRQNVATLEGAVSRQNAAVEAARREGAQRVAELDRVATRAREAARAANARAESILNRRGTGNHCADAEALIRESIR